MWSGIRRVVYRSLSLGVAAAICAASLAVATPYAYAGHETRTTDVQESGLDFWIIGLTLGLTVLGLILFGAGMLVWERRDATAGRSGASAGGHHPKS